MNFFSVFSISMICFSLLFTYESHAQYVPVFDSKGKVRSSYDKAAEEARNRQNKNNYSPSSKPPASQSSGKSKNLETNENRVNDKKIADANGLYVERSSSNNLYGYYNFITRQEVITHSFTDYKIQSEGYYALKLEKWGFLDKTGKVMIPFLYDEIHNIFENGIAKVEFAGKIFWIDKSGNEITEEKVKIIKSNARLARYLDVAPTADENGLRLATKKMNDKILYCYLNNENIEVISSDFYVNYLPFSEGFYALRVDLSSKNYYPFWVFVDKDNKKLANAWYSSIHNTFKNGKAKVTLYVSPNASEKEGATMWIDNQGNEVKVTPPSLLNKDQQDKANDLAYQAENLTNLYLGNNKFKLGNYSEAITLYTKVIQQNLKTTVTDAYFGRGRAKLLLNDLAGACIDLKMAVTLGHSDAKELMSKNCN